MLDQLQRNVASTRGLVAHLDTASLSGCEARTAVTAFVELERLAAAGRTLAIARMTETNTGPGNDSYRDVESWLAAIAGTSVGAAKGAVGTAQRVRKLPATADALRNGKLSPTQADAVSAAAKADPTAEDQLLEKAQSSGVRGLKAECDRVTAAAQSRARELDNYERIRANRSLRHRTLPDGTGAIDIRGPVDRTAQIMASLETFERELFERNRQAKNIEHPDAVAFDALVALCTRSTGGAAADPGDDPSADGAPTPPGSTQPKSRTRGGRPLAMVVLHISHAAYARGVTHRGEICEIEGIGPVPVAVARRLAADSIVKAVVIDGVDVTRVAHFGRTIPAQLRTAVETRDRACVIAGCEIDRHLEIDHNVPVAMRGETSLVNLGRVCHHHHDLKTRRDLRRIGPLGHQRLVTTAEYARAGP